MGMFLSCGLQDKHPTSIVDLHDSDLVYILHRP